jgi:hypothetical protein
MLRQVTGHYAITHPPRDFASADRAEIRDNGRVASPDGGPGTQAAPAGAAILRHYPPVKRLGVASSELPSASRPISDLAGNHDLSTDGRAMRNPGTRE